MNFIDNLLKTAISFDKLIFYGLSRRNWTDSSMVQISNNVKNLELSYSDLEKIHPHSEMF